MQNNYSVSYENRKSNVLVFNDGISIDGKFYTQEEFTNLLDNAIPVSKNNTTEMSTMSASAALVAGTWYIPGIGEAVVVTVAGVILIKGVVVPVGS